MSGILNLLLGSAAGVIKDAYFNLVTLLLNTTATNGAQNNTFLDSSTNNFSITRNGNTTQGTFTPFSQTGWSNYLDGSASTYLSFPSNTAFAWGTGAYTVEGWVYQTARATNDALFFGSGGSGGAFLAYIKGNGAVSIDNFGGSTVATGSANDVPLNTWVHLAYVRSSTASNDTKIYVNGVLKATGTDANNWTNSSSPIIGMLTNNTDYAIKGYISNFRAVKGTAVYTSAFTPPTAPLTAISGTSALTCQSNRFVDNSSNNFTVTPTGTASVQAFSPFAPTAAYSTSLVGGSGYFDGSGDYLSTSSNAAFAFGLSDFEVDFWIYATALPASDNNILNQNLSSGTPQFYIDSTGKLQYRNAFIGAVLTSNTTFKTGQWYYCVVSRVSLTARMFINGVLDTSGADANNWSNTAGWYISNNSGSFTGYISNVRLVNGSGITSSTVPTAPLTAITNTVLLTNFTNAGIYDSAAKNVNETAGNAQVSTATAQFGTTSMYFDGTGDCLQFPATPNFLFGGDFTIEGWFNRDNGADNSIFVMNTSGANYFAINVNSAGYNIYLNGSGPAFSPSVTLSNNTWYYFALVRSGSTVTLYHNGSSVGTTSNSSVLGSSSVVAYVGGINGGLKAYVDDLRITKYARTITASPTAAFPIQ
jgi:hypothetical protein